jgi:hypothetical protein
MIDYDECGAFGGNGLQRYPSDDTLSNRATICVGMLKLLRLRTTQHIENSDDTNIVIHFLLHILIIILSLRIACSNLF